MKINNIRIQNFRKLADINFNCKGSINTIVGPNGVGKSSIIEAIRLLKSILLQSQDNEAITALQVMGIFSPQNQSVTFDAICSDLNKQTKIGLTISLNEDELQFVTDRTSEFALLRLQYAIGQIPGSQLNLIGYLSTPAGQQQFNSIHQDTIQQLNDFKSYKKLADIELTINRGQSQGKNGFDQELISFIFRNTTSSQTLFSVFPADRNFPTGDANIQLGQGDLQQQLQSFSIQPNLKFQRLKNTIINNLLLNNNDIQPIKKDFELIFQHLLPGKELYGIRIEDSTNRLSVLIRESSNNAIYDIDFLSSGEKGLLLTLFLLIRTISKGGIVIIDEPELHLNPAVCRNIISFLKKHICEKMDIQIILTTHSAEILTETKEDESLQLLNLINPYTISPIYKNDNTEAAEAIKALGVSTADLLFNKGVIYLEGTTDEDYLNEVIRSYSVSFKVKSLGGRTVIENEIRTLQSSDKTGSLKGLHIFILDFDNKPTTLTSSNNVKVLQWDRYSFENYLLDIDTMYDVIRERGSAKFPSNRAEFTRTIKKLAFEQIDGFAINEVYTKAVPSSISLSKKELKSQKSALEVAHTLSDKILTLKNELEAFNKENWINDFVENATSQTDQLKEVWEANWKKQCKGKELLIGIYEYFELTNYKEFIKTIIRQNKINNTEEWQIITSKLESVILQTR